MMPPLYECLYDVLPEYRVWCNMVNRCRNPENKGWAYYGGRGIRVAPEWNGRGFGREDGFEAFLRYMGRRPSAQHSLDRIDNDGNYEPGNVRWATRSEQALNQRPWADLSPEERSAEMSRRRRKGLRKGK